MKNEFILAFNEIIEEKQLPKEVILQALESAMVSAYRRAVNASGNQHIEAKIDPETGKVSIKAEKEVVDSVLDDRTEVNLEDAKKANPEAEIGMLVIVESTPTDFGRVAAQTARQVIQQRIRDAERQAQLNYYQKQVGEIVSGIVQAVNSQGITIGLEMRAEANMSRKDMIPGERFHIHDRIRTLVAEVKDSPKGPQIILSRTHRDFLRRLLENEVPEIYHGVVEIRSIAREPGERAKVAVAATQPGIDPVGACVGIRGVRIQAIVRELHDEKIDVIEWNPDSSVFIAKAISPARVNGVYLSDKIGLNRTATVVVPEDQLSLAIGRDGQNARLAAKLTNWRIDIKSLTEAASDAVNRVQQETLLEAMLRAESDIIAQISGMLTKKSEGRPLTPEEYDAMAQFVDRVERKIAVEQTPVGIEDAGNVKDGLRSSIPAEMFEQNILDGALPEHVAYILQEAGYATVGDLVLQMIKQPDTVFKLQGIGPKAMTEINKLMESIQALKEQDKPEEISLTAAETEESEEIVSKTEAKPDAEIVTQIATPTEEGEQGVSTIEEPVVASENEEEGSEADIDFESIFQVKTEFIDIEESEDSEETEVGEDGVKKKKSKKKKKHAEIEYDPEKDLVIVKKKHKRGEGWEWE